MLKDASDIFERPGAAPTFARNVWHVAYWSSDIQAGRLYSRTLLGDSVVFFRTDGGAVAALEDMCPHRFAPLSFGRVVEGGLLECGYHGLRFDVSGACVDNPHGNHKIPPNAKTRSYPVVEKYSLVWIWLGSSEPDVDMIPDYHQFDETDEAFISKRDYMRLAADYRLITDNLIDLSHVPYLHTGLLANREAVVAEVNVVQEGTTVTQTRWAYNVPISSMHDMLFNNGGARVDSWAEMHWRPAGCMILEAGVCEPGKNKSGGTGYFGVHILTPEAAMTTHYFFAAVRFGIVPRTPAEDLDIRERISVARRLAFEEQDAPVVEAQQRKILESGGTRAPALLSVDAGPVRVQRVLRELIAAETALLS